MNSLRPLAFLFVRSLVNGVRRAVTSPKRLIALLAFGFYYYQMFLGRFGGPPPKLPLGGPQMTLPPASTVEAAVFCLTAVLSLVLMTSVMGHRGGFRPADVDVLFPTPVSPKSVLLFRVVRDTLATLLLPLVVGLLGRRSGGAALASVFRNYPEKGGDVARAFFGAYLLVSLVWICVGYAASLFVDRSDFTSERNRKRINAAIGLLILGLVAYVAFRLRMEPGWTTMVGVTQAPLVRVLLAPVTLATWAVMGAYQGQAGMALLGYGGLVALVAVALGVALTQVGWMYDQAAARGFDSGQNLRSLQRKGDLMAVQAERARQGKVRQGRVARRIAAIRARGPVALLWKEAILQARGSLSGIVVFGAAFMVAVALLMWAFAEDKGRDAAGWMLLTMQATVVYMLSLASSQSGFTEFLRRVDLQKPLPFTPGVTVFWEVVAKALAPAVVCLACSLVGVAFAPGVWLHALAGAVLGFPFAVMLTAMVLLVAVLFPDFDDPTQRGFRGLMMLLGIVIAVIPGAAVLAVGVLTLHLSPLVLSFPVAALDLGIAVGLSALAGELYANYNPTE